MQYINSLHSVSVLFFLGSESKQPVSSLDTASSVHASLSPASSNVCFLYQATDPCLSLYSWPCFLDTLSNDDHCKLLSFKVRCISDPNGIASKHRMQWLPSQRDLLLPYLESLLKGTNQLTFLSSSLTCCSSQGQCNQMHAPTLWAGREYFRKQTWLYECLLRELMIAKQFCIGLKGIHLPVVYSGWNKVNTALWVVFYKGYWYFFKDFPAVLFIML